jgi:hypothetical protein
MEGSVLSFLKAEWKVSDTGSAHWASSLRLFKVKINVNNFHFLVGDHVFIFLHVLYHYVIPVQFFLSITIGLIMYNLADT